MKKNKTKGLFASIVLGVAVTACAPASSSGTVTVVDRPDIQSVNTNYIGYRAPLRPLNFIKLPDRKSTRLNSSHTRPSRMPSSA